MAICQFELRRRVSSELQKRNERGNNKESSAEVTDVDAVGQEQEFAAQEQAGQTEGQSKQQQG